MKERSWRTPKNDKNIARQNAESPFCLDKQEVYVPESGWVVPDDNEAPYRFDKVLGRYVPINTMAEKHDVERAFGVRFPSVKERE